MSEPLPDVLRRRGIRRVVHAHADHFEPFSRTPDGRVMGPELVDEWIADTSVRDRGRMASLFFMSNAYAWAGDGGVDDTGFVRSSHYADESRVLASLRDARRDLHVHVHHESWTGSKTSGRLLSPADGPRLATYLDLMLSHLRFHGHALERWGFVHGCWALQGSDADICNVTDEVAILKSRGCVGDFTFPAGRGWCNPTVLFEPYTVRPVDARKGYDVPAAQPRPLRKPGTRALAPNRFLVWHCAQGYEDVSLDRVATDRRDAQTLAEAWVDNGWVYDNTLWVKTHAHSLMPAHFADGATTPLVAPPVVALFETLYRACDAAKVPCEHLTITDLLAELVARDGGRTDDAR